jgi:hypothetical protein
MRPRQFMELISGAAAAAVGPQAVRAARLPDTATRDSVQKEEQDFPFVIASIPATRQHRTIAAGIVILLSVVAAVIAPFASIQVARVNAFIPILQTVLSFVELSRRCFCLLNFQSNLNQPFSRSRAVTYSAARLRSCRRRWFLMADLPTVQEFMQGKDNARLDQLKAVPLQRD